MTKIIFLDFDGVLLPDNQAVDQSNQGLTMSNYLSTVEFDRDCVLHLNALLLASHAEIVLSTSWAQGHSIGDLSNCLMRNGIDPGHLFEYDDPSEKAYMTPRSSSSRSKQIEDWIAQHPEVNNWVALDDDSSVLHLGAHSVRTNPARGFDSEALNKAVKILMT